MNHVDRSAGSHMYRGRWAVPLLIHAGVVVGAAMSSTIVCVERTPRAAIASACESDHGTAVVVVVVAFTAPPARSS